MTPPRAPFICLRPSTSLGRIETKNQIVWVHATPLLPATRKTPSAIPIAATEKVRDAVSRHFPPGTRGTRPEGGFVLWVEMPEKVDSFRLHEEARKKGIGIAPGTLFSTAGRYGNCIRLNAAFWSEQVDQALETVGEMAERMV